MVKRGFFAILVLLLFFLASVSATSVDDEFKKIANYAGEYETGNIDYVQLLVYSSSVREKMNEILGATGREMGGVLKQEQIKNILGEPLEETKWVWSEGENKEIRLDNPAPVWKKIIFDGRKIQIRLNAWPTIFSKRDIEGENKNKNLEDLEGKLIYRLNFDIEFKKPEEQLNIQGKIDNIKAFAQTFNLNPSSGNAEALAKESVNAERTFESYFKQSGEKCEDVMSSIFGTENKRQTQQLLVQEISFCEGDNFEVIARLEMCDECEWNYINLDFHIEGRGSGFKQEEGEMNSISPESFKDMDAAKLQEEIGKIVEEMKQSCNNKDFSSIIAEKSKLWPLNDAWNQKSNNVWNEIDKTFKSQVESMTQEQRQEFDKNYGWIKQEQEKRQKSKELTKANYEKRKQFYSNLFTGYDKKDSYFTQIEFEKRLIEEFKERGEEICDNNKDDNKNEAIDCADEQCGGKVCGKGKNTIQEGNETRETEADFYCIEKECKAREEVQEFIKNVSSVCQEIPSIECPEGSKVFFSRYDNETNCPVETSCLKEIKSCEVNKDCKQPACGIAECVENKCELTKLTECRELECVDGDKKICESDGGIVEVCSNGFWEKTGECEEKPEIRKEVVVGNECLSANDCGNDNVCNNGVCQMLPKVTITPIEEIQSGEHEEQETQEQNSPKPEASPPEENNQEPVQEQTREPEQQPVESQISPELQQAQQQEAPQQSQESEPRTTGNIIFNVRDDRISEHPKVLKLTQGLFDFVGALFLKMKSTGAAITGFDTEGTASEQQQSSPEPTQEPQPSPPQEQPPREQFQDNQQPQPSPQELSQNPPQDNQQPREQNNLPVENQGREDNKNQINERREDNKNREREDERRGEENKERCKKECEKPCVEKCIREECGERLDCVIDEAQKKCEGNCEAGDDCVEKCMKGGDWWKEFENKDEHKEEKGVFQAGGSCRTSQGKTEGFIWFGGWGEPFEQIQSLKNKYYSGGQADWCKYDFENLKKQRQEFEKGFNQEFVAWFFEKHLANSAENWEQSVSGIFELYWKDVDNSREMAYRMQCLGVDELPSINLINVKYSTEYGSIEFWEEIKTVKLEGMDKEVQIVSPYMKAWVFPPKEFIIYEMKKSMKNHEFPGSPEEKMERKNQEGPTAEEREMIKQDEKFMKQIREISEKYNGLDISIQFKDYETNEVVFNLYAQVNENDILKIEPMLPEEIKQEDAKVEIDFKIIYDMIYEMEKEMRGERIESPPWDKQMKPVQKIKEITEGVKMFFKIRKIMNSAKISPAESEKDVRNLFKEFMSMIMKGGEGGGKQGKPDNQGEDNKGGDSKGVKEDVWKSKEAITGEVILR